MSNGTIDNVKTPDAVDKISVLDVILKALATQDKASDKSAELKVYDEMRFIDVNKEIHSVRNSYSNSHSSKQKSSHTRLSKKR
jgi:hypothetical protein